MEITFIIRSGLYMNFFLGNKRLGKTEIKRQYKCLHDSYSLLTKTTAITTHLGAERLKLNIKKGLDGMVLIETFNGVQACDSNKGRETERK